MWKKCYLIITDGNFTRKINITSVSEIRLRNEIRIIVIGAGIAGLSAASHLKNNGFDNTIIVEATERFGGRIRSKFFGDVCCELGAKWIAIDTTQNSVYELIRQEASLQKKIHKNSKKMYINIQGGSVSQELPDVMNMLLKRFCSYMELKNKHKEGILNNLNNVHTYFQAESKNIKPMLNYKEQNLANGVISNLRNEFSSFMGCCVECLSIENIAKMAINNTNSFYIPSGLENMLYPLTSNLDSKQVQLGKPVGFINWFDTSVLHKTTVCCMDGSLFPADHIICTLPLGVLKNFSKHMFSPMLPNKKINSISNLGFGSPVKIYIEYEEYINSWFPMNVRPIWSLQDASREWTWTNQIIEISYIPYSRRVLEILIGGPFFEEIEKLTDKEILYKMTKILRTWLQNPFVPYPISVLRSYWSSSACFLGGKPYFSIGTTVKDIETLASPLGKSLILLFAGDATILDGFGTIDGARKSGLREAERIIEYYNKK